MNYTYKGKRGFLKGKTLKEFPKKYLIQHYKDFFSECSEKQKQEFIFEMKRRSWDIHALNKEIQKECEEEQKIYQAILKMPKKHIQF